MRGPEPTVDWNLAKVLRGQGLTWKEISAKTNAKVQTLQVRASREGWNSIHKQTAKVLEEYATQTAVETIKKEAPKLAEAWLAEMQDDTVGRLKEIRKLAKPKNLDDAKKREEMMLTHVKAGRAAFGLDDQKGGGVAINIMSQLCQIAAVQQTANVADNLSDATAKTLADTSQVVDIEGE